MSVNDVPSRNVETCARGQVLYSDLEPLVYTNNTMGTTAAGKEDTVSPSSSRPSSPAVASSPRKERPDSPVRDDAGSPHGSASSEDTASAARQPASAAYSPAASGAYERSPVRHFLCLVVPLPPWLRHCLCLLVPAKTLPLPCGSTSSVAKTLPCLADFQKDAWPAAGELGPAPAMLAAAGPSHDGLAAGGGPAERPSANEPRMSAPAAPSNPPAPKPLKSVLRKDSAFGPSAVLANSSAGGAGVGLSASDRGNILADEDCRALTVRLKNSVAEGKVREERERTRRLHQAALLVDTDTDTDDEMDDAPMQGGSWFQSMFGGCGCAASHGEFPRT